MSLPMMLAHGQKVMAIKQLVDKYGHIRVAEITPEVMIDIVYSLSGKRMEESQAAYVVELLKEKGIDGLADAFNNPLAMASIVGYVRNLKSKDEVEKATPRFSLF